MRTDRVTRPGSEPVSIRPIVDRQTAVKTLPSLAVSNNIKFFQKDVASRLLSLGVNTLNQPKMKLGE